MTIDLQNLVSQSPQISSLPTIFYQINEAVEDPECSFVEIGEIISSDPSLSARLLRIVNSSYFGFPNKIETITHAVTIVGMAQLRDLALATTVVNQFKGIPKNLINMENFWLHSVATGLTAKIIAIWEGCYCCSIFLTLLKQSWENISWAAQCMLQRMKFWVLIMLRLQVS
jgi:HD-like signal output (HDOD) protein